MSYSNYPSAGDQPDNPTPQPKDNRKLIYGILIVALLATWGYIIYDKSKSKETISQLQSQYTSSDSARSAVENEYNAALARMDSLTGDNTRLQGELATQKESIDSLKTAIRSELARKDGDLSKARNMIKDLNGKITDLLAQVEQLKQENDTLTVRNTNLTVERDTLTSQKARVQDTLATTTSERNNLADVGSTLHASNINISSINVKGSGKEKATSTAKKVDVFRISFDLDENRIAPSGTKELYVCVTAPDGNPITIPGAGSGTFTTREEGDKVYTNKVDVQYEQGKRTPISFDWKPENGKYQQGMYKIQIYQNGYLIGQSNKSLKKGGLFG